MSKNNGWEASQQNKTILKLVDCSSNLMTNVMVLLHRVFPRSGNLSFLLFSLRFAGQLEQRRVDPQLLNPKFLNNDYINQS